MLMEKKTFDTETLFAGGRLCLDFVNTLCEVRGVEVELIGTGEELKQWLLQAEKVLVRPLCPDEGLWVSGYGANVLPRAIALRTALHDLMISVVEKAPVPVLALEAVNTVLRANPTYVQLGNDGGFQEAVLVSHPEDKWLVAIAQDAVHLLCQADLSLLRQCECPTCVRVFYDTTKNHKRRWCVEKCGSKPKAAAYYRRKIAKAALTR
jgi:predicted RNA-binding Zn ribbon-like protein